VSGRWSERGGFVRTEPRQDVRAQIVGLLNRRLADVIEVGTQTARAHSNMTGLHLGSLHQFFDEVHSAMEDFVDLLTERVVQIGGTPAVPARIAGEHSTLPGYHRARVAGGEPVHALAHALAEFGSQVRQATSQIRDWGDQESALICTEIARRVDQWQWFVTAHGRHRAEAAPHAQELSGGQP
jgi:starvation-inducible DNA-binding protein